MKREDEPVRLLFDPDVGMALRLEIADADADADADTGGSADADGGAGTGLGAGPGGGALDMSRLAMNQRALSAKITLGVGPSTVLSTKGSASTLLATRALLFGIGATVAVGIATLLFSSDRRGALPVVEVPSGAVVAPSVVAPTVVVTPLARLPRPPATRASESPVEDRATQSVPRPLPRPSMTERGRTPRGNRRRLAVEPKRSIESSPLQEQILRYEAARRLADRHEPDEALRMLDSILADFPSSSIAREIEIARVEYLLRANHFLEARRAIQLLLTQKEQSSQHGRLLRLLGDLWMKEGRCDRAMPVYRRALGLRLGELDRERAKYALWECKQNE